MSDLSCIVLTWLFCCPQRPVCRNQGVPGRRSTKQWALLPQWEHQVNGQAVMWSGWENEHYVTFLFQMAFPISLCHRWLLKTELGSFFKEYFQASSLWRYPTWKWGRPQVKENDFQSCYELSFMVCFRISSWTKVWNTLLRRSSCVRVGSV